MSIHKQSATEIVAAIKAGDLTAETITAHQKARIGKLNPALNAIVAMSDDRGPAKTGALCGLPVTFKDQIHVAGLPCTFGVSAFKDFRPAKNATIAQRLVDDGATVLGKTNLPPFAMDFQCSNDLFGTTNNPWDVRCTPGGSSGGGAASVAAGLSFLDIGSDLAGSLRIPASFCGVFSLLPSESAFKTDGMMPEGTPPLDHFARAGPIARSADDLALAWQVISGDQPEPGKVKLADVKLVWSTEAEGVPVCRRIIRRFAAAGDIWQRAGAMVSEDAPSDFSLAHARQVYGHIMGHETGAFLTGFQRKMARLFGRGAARRSPGFIAPVMAGYRRDPSQYQAALQEKRRLEVCVDAFLGEDRFWLLPVAATSVFKHMKPTSERGGSRDYAEPLLINGQPVNYFDALTAFTTSISLAGHPVVTIPLGLDDDGMPVGAQLIGRKGEDMVLLGVARALTAVLPVHVCPMLLDG